LAEGATSHGAGVGTGPVKPPGGHVGVGPYVAIGQGGDDTGGTRSNSFVIAGYPVTASIPTVMKRYSGAPLGVGVGGPEGGQRSDHFSPVNSTTHKQATG